MAIMEMRYVLLKLIMDEVGLVPGIASGEELQKRLLNLYDKGIDLGYWFRYYGKERRSAHLYEDYSGLIEALHCGETGWEGKELIHPLQEQIRKVMDYD